MACPSCHRRRKNWAWQIVAGRVRPHEKQIRRTARAPAARCGASGARPNRRASDLCFRSARNARLAPACPDGRFDRMMTLFLRSGTSRTTGPACWPRLGGANRGSTDLNWTLIGVARVCRTSLQVVFYSSRNITINGFWREGACMKNGAVEITLPSLLPLFGGIVRTETTS